MTGACLPPHLIPIADPGDRATASILERGAALCWSLELIGAPPYDRSMRRVHNDLKKDDAFQAAAAREVLERAPGSSWAALTDLVRHGVIRGQHARAATVRVDREASAPPARHPWRPLEAPGQIAVSA